MSPPLDSHKLQPNELKKLTVRGISRTLLHRSMLDIWIVIFDHIGLKRGKALLLQSSGSVLRQLMKMLPKVIDLTMGDVAVQEHGLGKVKSIGSMTMVQECWSQRVRHWGQMAAHHRRCVISLIRLA
jgi:hypothetical protein